MVNQMLTVLLAASSLSSATPAPEAISLAPELQPLAFLVGSCWRGTFPDGRQTDTHCFTPMLGGAFVRDVHVVEGAPRPYSGETLYRWDASARQIRFEYYALDASHSAGSAIAVADGLNFPETHRAADGSEMAIQTSWVRDGADAYFVTSEARTGETRRQLLRMRMERVGPAR